MDIIKNISIIFTSIFFESLPFLLLGSLISAIIETYVSNETIAKIIPKNKILGSIVGVCLGFFLPACDCAVIPVSKRLLKKKVPVNVAISFMLASPIINPVVLLSTYYAFYKTNPNIFFCRLLFGIIISLIIGIIMGIVYGKKEVTTNNIEDCECHKHEEIDEDFMDLAEELGEVECDCHHGPHSLKNDILNIFKHTAYDMFEVIKYLMFGALLASFIQVLLPRNVLLIFKENKILSVVIMMIFAYLISLCSTSDSFVGKSLLSSFNQNAIIAYLLLGPMIDIKNTIVLLGNYKKNFVITLISLIFITIFIFSMVVIKI
ncbi:MAG: permease [Bacilli bacterium]|nr:permease [Bacilli bacterium]